MTFQLTPPPSDRPWEGSALFVEARTGERYRYTLTRQIAGVHDTKRVVFIGLNPSNADGENDDATIVRLKGFVERWSCTSFEIVNADAIVNASPSIVRGWKRAGKDIRGPQCDHYITRALLQKQVYKVVCCWGNNISRGRGWALLELVRRIGWVPLCFGMTGQRQPIHPLYLPYSTQLVEVTA